jgi:hypothetical protein
MHKHRQENSQFFWLFLKIRSEFPEQFSAAQTRFRNIAVSSWRPDQKRDNRDDDLNAPSGNAISVEELNAVMSGK